MEEPLITYLQSFLGDERVQRLHSVLSRRTEYLTVVLEDLHYSQNSSSIIRHCDAFGIQNLHVIENRNMFKVKNHAVRGTLKWISLHQHNGQRNNSLAAIKHLKDRGYRIVATTPRKEGYYPQNFDLEAGPAAIFFGNERNGLSDDILNNADAHITIPIEGFVESLNVSASCAIILHELCSKLRGSKIPWQLEQRRYEQLMISWLKGSIKKIDYILKEWTNSM